MGFVSSSMASTAAVWISRIGRNIWFLELRQAPLCCHGHGILGQGLNEGWGRRRRVVPDHDDVPAGGDVARGEIL